MIIIIGASSGIGIKLAQQLVKFDNVLATYNKKKIKIKTHKNKYKIIFKQLDISKEKNIKRFIDENSKLLKNITFINLATISVDKLIPHITMNDIIKVFQINTFSNILFAKFLLKKMMTDNYGRFIHLTSTRASRGDVGISLYSASKSTLCSLSKCISKEYGRLNITSNVISLGYFKSPLLENIDKKIKDNLLKKIPSQKTGDVKNISNVIKTIIKSNYINGAEIKVDGGI